MRKIDKGPEPAALSQFKKKFPKTSVYDDLHSDVRQSIRKACTTEQFGLCAYCCTAISGEDSDTMNEHVEARRLAPNRSLDFQNIVASCRTKKQCDAAHGSQALPLTPLMPECESELKFLLSGCVEGLSKRAWETIQVLNLGKSRNENSSLVEKRKRLVDILLWNQGLSEDDLLQLENDELLLMVIEDLQMPKQGKLEPFSPILVNILRSWMQIS